MTKKLLALAIVSFLFITCLVGCVDKEPATSNEFKSTAESLGYTVEDVTSQFESTDGVNKVYLALKDGYQIEFFDVASNEYAESAFNINKENFEETYNAYIQLSTHLGNTSKYSLQSGDSYVVISQIENTFIYVDSKEIYKSEIDDTLDALGY